ncbi:MAG: zinc transporter ZntB [bacterium]
MNSNLPASNPIDGIVSLFTLDGAGGGERLEKLPAQLPLPFWLHLQSDHLSCAEILRTLGASQLLCQSMTMPETRPRVLVDASGVLIVLRGVNMGIDADPEDMVSLRIWLTPEFVVTARKSERRLLSVQDLQAQVQAGTGPVTPQELVVTLVSLLAERIGKVVNESEDALAHIEENLEHLAAGEARARLTQQRRRAARLKRYLAPQRDALDGLYRLQNVLNEAQAQQLREQSDRTTRYVEDLELARELAMLLQEELRNRIAEQQNARMYVLSLVAAIFLPLSFLTGVFGMNVMGLPGVEDPQGFVYVSAGMLVLGSALATWMWKRKWL